MLPAHTHAVYLVQSVSEISSLAREQCHLSVPLPFTLQDLAKVKLWGKSASRKVAVTAGPVHLKRQLTNPESCPISDWAPIGGPVRPLLQVRHDSHLTHLVTCHVAWYAGYVTRYVTCHRSLVLAEYLTCRSGAYFRNSESGMVCAVVARTHRNVIVLTTATCAVVVTEACNTVSTGVQCHKSCPPNLLQVSPVMVRLSKMSSIVHGTSQALCGLERKVHNIVATHNPHNYQSPPAGTCDQILLSKLDELSD